MARLPPLGDAHLNCLGRSALASSASAQGLRSLEEMVAAALKGVQYSVHGRELHVRPGFRAGAVARVGMLEHVALGEAHLNR